ncbi:MAG: DNA repair protein RadA [Oscillospiraceae bacterium]|jgi:DNA repair protein RadA/Sms|nr:DNA repair protein RadA [Oscillospiraceae bacterium]
MKASNKTKIIFVCAECGYESAKWSGRCPACGAGNSMIEESRNLAQSSVKLSKKVDVPIRSKDINIEHDIRFSTGINELDRVFGGGIVKGSLVLLGGAPGIGKSTILLQLTDCFKDVLYISGEESKSQIKMRSLRLGIKNTDFMIMSETDINSISNTIKELNPQLVIIDSIQTMISGNVLSVPGSVSQVKECASVLLETAKRVDVPILIVSHINKGGAIAGPKVLEHIVDVVLYFEGENSTSYRIIRAVKNRYGSTNEIGVFQMGSKGLDEVPNPSAVMLTGRAKDCSGTCVACAVEGSRPILTEVQALVSKMAFAGNPRRMAAGFDYNRLCLILAVLEKRAGFFFANADVYVNVTGGMKLDDPSADLAVCAALISALKDIVISENTLIFGEIGLSGEIRPSSHARNRIEEARRLGFKNFIIPRHNIDDIIGLECKIKAIRSIRELTKTLEH